MTDRIVVPPKDKPFNPDYDELEEIAGNIKRLQKVQDRIIVKEGEIHKVRKPMDVGPLYQLVRYCYEKDLRFGQALCYVFELPDLDLFYMENDELEKRIKEFIKQ